MITDHDGAPLAVGDRIVPLGIVDNVPAYLASTQATIVGFGRTRIRVQFDMESYGGRFPEFRAIGTYVRKVS